MKLNEAYPSKYLTADDLNGKDVTCTIEEVELDDIGQGADKSRKLVIGFAGKQKKFVVNRTNANTIAKLCGEDTDEWPGKQITIGPREVEFKGDMVWAIRVSLRKPITAPVNPAAAPLVPADQDGDGESEIPF